MFVTTKTFEAFQRLDDLRFDRIEKRYWRIEERYWEVIQELSDLKKRHNLLLDELKLYEEKLPEAVRLRSKGSPERGDDR